MYRFTADEQHLLLMDCLGLTRWSSPKGLKTDRTFTAGAQGQVSISAAGDAAIAYRDGWCSTARFDFPSLKKTKSYERFRQPHGVISPDGTRILHTGGFTSDPNLILSSIDGARLRHTNIPGMDAPLIELGLGESEDNRLLSPLFTVSPDGHFVQADWRSPICYGRLDPETLEPTVLLKVRHQPPPVNWSRAWPSASGLVVAVLDPLKATCTIVHFADGREQQRWELTAISLPAVSETHIAWQPDAGTVICQDRGSGAQETFDIAEITAKAHARKSPRPAWLEGLDSAGRGTLIIGRSRLILLPWHRETFLDLRSGVETPRKLPEQEHHIRRLALSHIETMVTELRQRGSDCELVNLDIKSNNTSFSLRVAGESGKAIADSLYQQFKTAGVRCGSYSY